MLAWTLMITGMSLTITTVAATAKFFRTTITTATVTTTSIVMGKSTLQLYHSSHELHLKHLYGHQSQ